GHVGGDDFVAVFDQRCDWQALCEQVLQRFDREIPRFYRAEDKLRQGILATARNGEPQFYPLLGLAIGVVAPDAQYCHSHHDVAALASDAKHQAKQHPHSHCLLSSRRTPA
ncbi:MAG: hypothetical protein GYB38_13335, partial [Gammaproteobacteria bacterium]|nr:hypothetical protein [Gammaproteobacteria bacterium]